MKTTYIVQTFTRQKSGRKSRLIPDSPMQFNDSREAIRRAEGKVLAQFGEVPAGVAGYDD